MDVALARGWIVAVAATLAEQADQLTRLDSAIGDGDHGVNLNRGFAAVLAALEGYEPANAGDLLGKVGTTLVSKVGGASGPLYGMALRAMGKALNESTLEVALRAGLESVQKLGGAMPGDKTIVDAYQPALEAFEAATAAGDNLVAASAAAAEAARSGMIATTAMQARKGRASYLGERSVGHQDPGATSTWLIFQALASAAAARS